MFIYIISRADKFKKQKKKNNSMVWHINLYFDDWIDRAKRREKKLGHQPRRLCMNPTWPFWQIPPPSILVVQEVENIVHLATHRLFPNAQRLKVRPVYFSRYLENYASLYSILRIWGIKWCNLRPWCCNFRHVFPSLPGTLVQITSAVLRVYVF